MKRYVANIKLPPYMLVNNKLVWARINIDVENDMVCSVELELIVNLVTVFRTHTERILPA